MPNSVIIDRLLAKTRRSDIPEFVPGDTVRVQVKIKEGDKERLQAFEGLVISKSAGNQPSFNRKMHYRIKSPRSRQKSA
jgi:large subunit ribosomal protein L19